MQWAGSRKESSPAGGAGDGINDLAAPDSTLSRPSGLQRHCRTRAAGTAHGSGTASAALKHSDTGREAAFQLYHGGVKPVLWF